MVWWFDGEASSHSCASQSSDSATIHTVGTHDAPRARKSEVKDRLITNDIVESDIYLRSSAQTDADKRFSLQDFPPGCG